jgi:methyl-accepting chemotaxis protein
MAFLKNIGVNFQIGIIGALALIGFVVVGAIYYTSSTEQAVIQETQLTETGGVRAVEAAKYGFVDARQHEKDFLIRLDMKYAEDHKAVIEGVLPHFEALKTIHAEPDEQALIDEMRVGILAYAEQFNEVVGMWQRIGLTPGDGLRGALRKAVGEVEAKLTEFDDQRLTSTMLLMRRHEKDFMLRRDMKYDTRHNKTMVEFDKQLAASTIIPAAEKANIEARLDAYMKEFDAVVELLLEEIEDKKAMSDRFAEVAPKLEFLANKGSEDAAHATDELRENTTATFQFMMIAMAVVAAVVAALATLIGRGISGPIGAMTASMGRLADGDLEVDIPAQGQTNEIGKMAQAVQVFKENAHKVRRMEQEREADTRRSQRKVQSELRALNNAMDEEVQEAVSSVTEKTDEMQASAQGMAATAEETSRQATAVAAASEQASTNVQTVASAAEELSSSIAEISRQVAQSSQIAATAVTDAQYTDQKIQGLAEASSKIGEVVALITDIAEQTNLLALNATIEAARAGDSGKGFAVVASEVKNLANQTARATDEIAGQIGGIQSATQEAVTAIQGIGKTIGSIDEIASTIAAAVEEQGAATQEIARNVEQAAAGTREVSENISGVTQAAGETGEVATKQLTISNEVGDQVKRMQDRLAKLTADSVNPHLSERHTVNMAAKITVDGANDNCLLHEISRGGAAILDHLAGIGEGTEFEIDIPGLGRMLGAVIATTGESTHVRFDLEDAQIKALDEFVTSAIAKRSHRKSA